MNSKSLPNQSCEVTMRAWRAASVFCRTLWVITCSGICLWMLLQHSIDGNRESFLMSPPAFPAAQIREVLPPPLFNESTCTNSTDTMCVRVYTGTFSVVYHISNSEGIDGFQEYHLVNFDQRRLGSTSDSIDIEVTTQYYVDTRTPYPVNVSALPPSIKDTYLRPEPQIQSDNPEIVAKALELVSGTTLQAEAVDAILTWVIANIDYDSNAPGNDALSVFKNHRAVCAGFSRLATALMRAAGIPARYHSGCATPYGYITGDGGGRHAWVESYYPDVGWIASEPQSSTNFIGPMVIALGFEQCGDSDTVISMVSFSDYRFDVYELRTPYDDSIRYASSAASIPSWDRHPLRVMPSSPYVMLPVTDPEGTFTFHVQNLSCYAADWQVRSASPWLDPAIVTGTTAGYVSLSVNAAGMSHGSYTTPLTLYSTSSLDDWVIQQALSRTLTVTLRLVDQLYETHLPIIQRRH